MKKPIIFLDFDGVLFDSVLESYLLSRYAYYGIDPKKEVNKEEYDFFYSVRYLITQSWHYYYIMQLIEKKIPLEVFADEYNLAITNRNIEKDYNFDKIFQEKRKDLIENYFEFWNKLDKPYTFFEKVKHTSNKFNIFIVSTKNELAILKHCNDYGFNIDKNNIIGKSKLRTYGSKFNFLKKYIEDNNIKKAFFIDDNKETIENCSKIENLTSFVANWGYVANKSDGLSEDEILKFLEGKA